MHETPCAITVASDAPITPRLNFAIKTISRKILRIVEIIRKIIGVKLLPSARSKFACAL